MTDEERTYYVETLEQIRFRSEEKCYSGEVEALDVAIELLETIKNYESGIKEIQEQINNLKGNEMWTEANAMEWALEMLGVYKGKEVYHIQMGAVKNEE